MLNLMNLKSRKKNEVKEERRKAWEPIWHAPLSQERRDASGAKRGRVERSETYRIRKWREGKRERDIPNTERESGGEVEEDGKGKSEWSERECRGTTKGASW
jgi:hypothetical protein